MTKRRKSVTIPTDRRRREERWTRRLCLGPKGQIVVPKEVREMFGIRPGDTLLLLADVNRGIALQTFEKADPVFRDVFSDREQ